MPNRQRNTRRGQRKNPKRKRRAARKGGRAPTIDRYARMIADPCNCTLTPGLHGTSQGFLARLKNVVDNAAPAPHGYLLWCPRYHNGSMTSDGNRACLFGYATDDTGIRPVNDTNIGSYFGQAQSFLDSFAATTAASFSDPAHFIVSAGLVQDARLLSACMRMTYTGRLDRSAGQVAFIENVPLVSLIGDEAKGPTLSVDDLFRMSDSVQRIGVDTLEVVHRPDLELASVFHDTNDAGLFKKPGDTYTHLATSGEMTQPTVFGFAWRNLSTSAETPLANLTFDLTKNIEWRPKPLAGITVVTPKVTGPPGVLARTIETLDRIDPSWSKRILDSASSLAGKVVTMAATGVAQRIGTLGPKLLLGL